MIIYLKNFLVLSVILFLLIKKYKLIKCIKEMRVEMTLISFTKELWREASYKIFIKCKIIKDVLVIELNILSISILLWSIMISIRRNICVKK